MPYHLQETPTGWFVVTTSTGRRHSAEPLTKSKALAQMKALYVHLPEERASKKPRKA